VGKPAVKAPALEAPLTSRSRSSSPRQRLGVLVVIEDSLPTGALHLFGVGVLEVERHGDLGLAGCNRLEHHLGPAVAEGVIPDSVSSSPNGDELTRPKG